MDRGGGVKGAVVLCCTGLYCTLYRQGRTGNVQETLERGRSGGTMGNSYAGQRIDAGRTS